MKKFLGAIISGSLGVLGFIFLSLKNFVIKVNPIDHGSNAWEILKAGDDWNNFAGSKLYNISTVILIIVATLLIILAIIMLLQSLNVLKIKFNLNLIANVLVSVFALFALLAFIATFVYAKDAFGIIDEGYIGAGIGAWFNLIVGAIACSCGWLFARK